MILQLFICILLFRVFTVPFLLHSIFIHSLFSYLSFSPNFPFSFLGGWNSPALRGQQQPAYYPPFFAFPFVSYNLLAYSLKHKVSNSSRFVFWSVRLGLPSRQALSVFLMRGFTGTRYFRFRSASPVVSGSCRSRASIRTRHPVAACLFGSRP